tara:strand:+ start:332 stop:1510 length:1179 start_codon:yes stop_codon:yes gene_type:complete
LLEVALDRHRILMLKNKIYNYLSNEILKNFIIILITFTAIAWVVRAVNFLDIMVEDGYSTSVYFKYSLLNITNILTRFIPLAFLLSLTVSIVKFERQQELLILWTSGLAKIKIVNIFLLIAFVATLFQLILSLFVNPFLLNKSRFLLSDTATLQINSVLRSNDFSDTFKGLTIYIGKKNTANELLNVFIKDTNGSLSTLLNEVDEKNNSVIVAKKGFATKNKLVLFNGTIQTLNKKNEIKNIKFVKTELNLSNVTTRTIKQAKIQETSSSLLFQCIFNKDKNFNITNCKKNNYKSEVVQNLSRRLGMPLYIPLITVIVSFLLIQKKEKKYIFLDKYLVFTLSFLLLIISEIFLKYAGLSLLMTSTYFILPVIITFLFYILLLKKIITENVSK